MDSLFLIVVIIAFGGLMWWQSRKAKQQRQQVDDFRNQLEPGTEVITIGGVIGKVVSVDTKYEEIVIDSEGSELRFKSSAINKAYTRPAFIDDADVDADGNPLPAEDAADAAAGDEAAQRPYDALTSADSTTSTNSTNSADVVDDDINGSLQNNQSDDADVDTRHAAQGPENQRRIIDTTISSPDAQGTNR